MKTHPLTRRHWHMVALGALVLGLLFVMPFIGIIALAALMAFLFYGVFERLARHMNGSVAATITIVVSLLVVIVPVALIIMFTAVQLTQLAAQLSTVVVHEGGAWSLGSIIGTVNSLLAPFVGNSDGLSLAGVLEFVRTTLPGVIRGMAAFMTNIIGGIPMMIILSIMYLILLYEFLVYGKTITASIVALSPFQPEVSRLHLERVGLMANAMVKGQFYISFIISLLSALILSVFLGLGEYFFLMTVVFTLLNLIPLGCGILVIPMTIIAMLSGAFWPGLIALLLYIVVSHLDAVIRPRIIPRSITLSPGLTMLAAFGGISLFGVLGVVYGPMLMIVIVTAIQMYLEDYRAPQAWRRRAER